MTPASKLWRAIGYGAVLLILAGCQNGGLTQGPKLANDQTLRVMISDQPASLDPGQTQYTYETAVLRAISEPLLRPTSDLTGVVPAAAQSYESNADGTAYVFHLRTNAKYWDGVPVKAEDFVYAWQRLIDPRLASPDETIFAATVLNGQRVSLLDPQRDAATIDAALGTLGLKALDDSTFQVQLARPDPAFVWLAALPAGGPIRKDVVTKYGDKWAADPTTLVTNGPFKVAQMTANSDIQVDRNPQYWGGRPTLSKIDFMIVNDGAAALAKYKSGDLDEISVDLPQAATVAGDAGLSRQLAKTPDLTVFWMTFRTDSPPLDNVKLRVALAQAIDRNAFVSQILSGEGLPISTFIPKGMRGYSPGLATQKFDLAQARASLAASGLKASQVSLTLSYDQSSDFKTKAAKFVHDQLVSNLGINVALQGLDPNTLSSHKDTGDFQITGPDGWNADYPDPADWFDFFLTTSSYNVSLWQNQQYDNFVRVARTDTNQSRRDQEYLQAQTMLVDEAPVAFLAQTASWYLVQPYVRGVVTSPVDEWPGALGPTQLWIAPH
ncbi:MAG TPA: peptide ABC transporter substrate-binding protein [Candidatus Udaeobacter sp.]|nr:peptide ABC transporter substrate-binding protein [Candidatus Udaeobacter sp.]